MWSYSAGLAAGLATSVRGIIHAINLSSQSMWEIHAMQFVGIPFRVIEATESLKASSHIFNNGMTSNHGPLSGEIS